MIQECSSNDGSEDVANATESEHESVNGGEIFHAKELHEHESVADKVAGAEEAPDSGDQTEHPEVF